MVSTLLSTTRGKCRRFTGVDLSDAVVPGILMLELYGLGLDEGLGGVLLWV